MSSCNDFKKISTMPIYCGKNVIHTTRHCEKDVDKCWGKKKNGDKFIHNEKTLKEPPGTVDILPYCSL